jgi:S1-C subfamily serine protease
MMGLESATDADGSASASLMDPTAEHRLTSADHAWLARTLSQVETRDGRAHGWRVADAPPGAVTRAGLQSGDLVVGVNGAGPDNLAAVAAAARANTLVLEVERNGGRVTISLETGDRT